MSGEANGDGERNEYTMRRASMRQRRSGRFESDPAHPMTPARIRRAAALLNEHAAMIKNSHCVHRMDGRRVEWVSSDIVPVDDVARDIERHEELRALSRELYALARARGKGK